MNRTMKGLIGTILSLFLLLAGCSAPADSTNSSMFHMYNHENDENERAECGEGTIYQHLSWGDSFTRKIFTSLKQENNIVSIDGIIKLTKEGRANSINSYNKLFLS